MKVTISTGFGGMGPDRVVDTGSFKYVYKENYDGAEYLLMSDSPVFTHRTKYDKDGNLCQEVDELQSRIQEVPNSEV